MASINEGTAGQHRAGKHRDRTELAENTVCRCPDKNGCETLSLRRWRRKLERDDRRSAPRSGHRRRRSAGRAIGSKKFADRVLDERGLLEIDRWREDLGRLA